MSLLTALRIAWRDILASKSKFVFIMLAVAVGVGALTGVRSFGRAFRTLLASEARTLMAGDLSVRIFEPPNPNQEKLFDEFAAEHVRRTWITETVTMATPAASAGETTPVLVSVKGVDPRDYPFYGEVKLSPPARLADVLNAETVGVSEDLLVRLDLKTGDRLKLGGAEFTIAGIVVSEPDKMTGSLNIGARVLMTRDGLDRAGLLKLGSRASQRELFKIDPGAPPLATLRPQLEAAFPAALVTDYRETHPLITRGLDRSERFLSLIGLIALIVGSLGVAATIHAHLEQRLDTIAILKCLGARNNKVLHIYVLQTLLVALAGGVLGSLIGAGVQASFPTLIKKYFDLEPKFSWDWWASVEGIAIGLLTSTLFTIPVLLSVKRIKPLVILRRSFEDRTSWYRTPGPWLAGAAILLGICAIAGWLAGGTWNDRARVGGFFAGGLVASLIFLAAVAKAALAGLRAIAKNSSRWPLNLRHGVANVFRPGNQAEAVLVSLGIGVMFTMTVFLMQRGLVDQLVASAPPGTPNVFLINIGARERDGIAALLKAHADSIIGTPEVIEATPVKLETVDGKPVASLVPEARRRRYDGPRAVTEATKPRAASDVTQGQWWSATAPGLNLQATRKVCMVDTMADELKIHPGAKLAFTAGLDMLDAELACVFRNEEVQMGTNFEMVFSPGSLAGLPMQYFALARMKPAAVGRFQRDAFRQFPSVAVINGADVLGIVQDVVDQIALVVRFISAFAILAGVIILASSVASTRFHRVREVAVLKTLGAKRARIGGIFSVEFLILGGLAGLVGGALATGFSQAVLVNLLEARFRFDWVANVAAVVLSALIANAAGWLASARILGEKPLEVLRGE